MKNSVLVSNRISPAARVVNAAMDTLTPMVASPKVTFSALRKKGAAWYACPRCTTKSTDTPARRWITLVRAREAASKAGREACEYGYRDGFKHP